jgi:hypothetical protein
VQLLRWRQHVVRMRPSHENTIEQSGARPRYAALQMATLRSFAPRSHARNHGTISHASKHEWGRTHPPLALRLSQHLLRRRADAHLQPPKKEMSGNILVLKA